MTTSGDTRFLEALLGYQQQAVLAYERALESGSFSAQDERVLRGLSDQARQSAAALRKAVVRAGGTPPAAAPLAPTSGRDGYLESITGAEDAAVGGYYVSLQALYGAKLIRGVSAFMAQAGRRLVALRDLAGDPLVPRAFETGEG